MGIVKAVEATELERLAIRKTAALPGLRFSSPRRRSLSIQPYIAGVSRMMPAMDAKESWSPAAAMESGFAMSSIRSPAHSEVMPSASRLSSGASMTNISMTQALTTEAVQPATSVNSTMTGTPTKDARLLPSSVTSTAYRNDRCMPDTATTWRMPAIDRALSSS